MNNTPEPAGRYRPKLTLEAVRWDGHPVTASVIIDWMLASGGTARYHDEPSALSINTERGTKTAVPGDWVVRGYHGDFWPLTDDEFAATYEPAAAVPGRDATDGGELK